MKKWIAWLILLVLCVSLAACGMDTQTKAEKDGTKPAATSETTESSGTVPTQPSEPDQNIDPTLPAEGNDPGGFGTIF